jgi:CRP-like cAMP-binding protein
VCKRRILCQRLRQTSEQVEDVLFRHLESWVAKAVLHLAEDATSHAFSGSPVELHLSQQELGDIAGGTRESVNKKSSGTGRKRAGASASMGRS